MASDECSYYYYDSGYCCSLKREKEGSSSIDEDTVKKYCWGYHYSDCPRYKNRDSSSGGCYLTSACTEARGLPDNCEELTTLRAFRDGYMKSLPHGQADICEYYHTAPAIVEHIRSLPNAKEIFDGIYTELVVPCVELIHERKNEEAYNKYRKYVKLLQGQYFP